jgi:hypothetical protein
MSRIRNTAGKLGYLSPSSWCVFVRCDQARRRASLTRCSLRRGRGETPWTPPSTGMSSHSARWGNLYARISVADPGSGNFLTPGSRIPDPKPIFLKDSITLCKLAQIFFFTSSKIRKFTIVWCLYQKKYDNIFFTHLFCCCFWIRDGQKSGFGIRDKHPGSATQVTLSPKSNRNIACFHLSYARDGDAFCNFENYLPREFLLENVKYPGFTNAKQSRGSGSGFGLIDKKIFLIRIRVDLKSRIRIRT